MIFSYAANECLSSSKITADTDQSSFVELSNVPKAENSGFSSHILANVKLNLGTSISLTMENADAGALAELVIKIMKEAEVCSD